MSTVTTGPRPTLAAPPDALDDDPPVRAVMTSLEPVEVPAETRVATALARLRSLDAGHLVVRREDRFRAVAEVDLLRHLLEGGARPTRMLDPVSDLATPVRAVGPTLRRSQAADLLLSGDPVLVVVEDGVPTGLLDAASVLHSVAGDRRGPP